MAAGLSDSARTNLLKLLFQNVTWAGVGDVTGLVGSSTAGVFWISLHTADPGQAGNQSTNEATYTNYARVSVARSPSKLAVSNNEVSNVDPVTFPVCGATGKTATYFAIGTAENGAGTLLAIGQLSGGGLAISNNIEPAFKAGELTSTVL